MMCDGGPRTRAWYFESDWTEELRIARDAGESAFDGRTLGYVETDGVVDQP
jgi:hypothetical protein